MFTHARATLRLAVEYFDGQKDAFVDLRIHHDGETTKFRHWEGSVIFEEDGIIYIPARWFWSIFRSFTPEHLGLLRQNLPIRRFAGRQCVAYSDELFTPMTLSVVETVKSTLVMPLWGDAYNELRLYGLIEQEIDLDDLREERAARFFSKPQFFRCKIIMAGASPAGFPVEDVEGSGWQFYLKREQIPDEIWEEFDSTQLICFILLPGGEYTDFKLEEPEEVLVYAL